MKSWFAFLRNGLSRRQFVDSVSGISASPDLKSSFRSLYPFIAPKWKKGALGALFVLASSLLALPQPLIIRFLVDNVILSRQPELLAGAVVLLIVIVLAEKLSLLWQDFYFSRLEQEIILEVQKELLRRTLRFPKSFFDGQETGYLTSRLSADVQNLRWFFSGTVVQIASNLLRFAGGMAFLFYLEWRLALPVLVLFPGLFLLLRYLSSRLLILSHHSMEQEGRIRSRYQESLSSIPLIKAFTAEGRTLGRLLTELRGAMQTSLEQTTIHSAATLMIDSLPGIARAALLAFGGYWVITGEWTLGSLLAFQVYLGYVFGPAQFLASANLQLQNARAALERVSALLEVAPEENRGRENAGGLRGEVEFKNVCFSYAHEPVLRDVSFRVLPGERVGIAGPSGTGKSTLVSLILQFYKPASGEILFDGLSAEEYALDFLRSRLGYVPQSTFLFTGTILENLRFGNPGATMEEVRRAAEAAEIQDFIARLPEGYETKLGENGLNLSEGQRQRLSLARALVRDPDIIILDEPTSALDIQTEDTIFRSLPAIVRGKTLFIIAHRLSTLRDCDRILLLQGSSLAASGALEKADSPLEPSNFFPPHGERKIDLCALDGAAEI